MARKYRQVLRRRRAVLAAPRPRPDILGLTGFEGLLAIVIVALMPVALVFISRHYALREKQLTARADVEGRKIEELMEARRLLEARMEAVESIVCTVEFDLDQRLHR